MRMRWVHGELLIGPGLVFQPREQEALRLAAGAESIRAGWVTRDVGDGSVEIEHVSAVMLVSYRFLEEDRATWGGLVVTEEGDRAVEMLATAQSKDGV